MDIQPNLSDSNLSQPVNILNVVTSHERRYFGYNYYQKPIFVFFVVVHNYDKDTLFSKPYNHGGRVLFDLTKCIVQAVCLNKIQGCIILKPDEQIPKCNEVELRLHSTNCYSGEVSFPVVKRMYVSIAIVLLPYSTIPRKLRLWCIMGYREVNDL